LFRVLQEALHNVTKHSRCTDVHVRLGQQGEQLRLVIADDGVGFDSQLQNGMPGLGLISMRERMHLVGGTFDVWSKRLCGTTISASAPLDGVMRPVVAELQECMA
jgi:signal transduction histidine kinase